MRRLYSPEGGIFGTTENREALSSPASLEKAMREGRIVEGLATRCDERMRLHVDLGCAHGVIEPEDSVMCRVGEVRKDIATISRVGKAVACKITGLDLRDGILTARLSRTEAQRECLDHYLRTLRAGDLIPAKVTHMEPFGAFLDIGCGVSSLLSVDCISVSRISHPRDRLTLGMPLTVAVKCINQETERIYVTLRELLGTWLENAASFEAGQTVTGIIRSVESYGVFVELTPNLAGLAEVSEERAAELRGKIGQRAAVYIKSIVPERMKIKLVLVDSCTVPVTTPTPLRFFTASFEEGHAERWRYSPPVCPKSVETVFGE